MQITENQCCESAAWAEPLTKSAAPAGSRACEIYPEVCNSCALATAGPPPSLTPKTFRKLQNMLLEKLQKPMQINAFSIKIREINKTH